MRRTLLPLLALTAALTATAQEPADTTATDSVGFRFTDVRYVRSTPVRDQNKSGTCWCFSGTSFFEDEILRKGGDSLHLSEMYTVRQCYLDKAEKYIRMNGTINFAQGGSGLDVPYVWKRYGVIPESAYPGLSYGEDNHVHGELAAALKAYLDAINRNPNRRLSTAWKRGVEAILDAYLGEVPETFEVNGKTYTPATYAASLGINLDDYVALTSFTHHPYYESFPLEVADNWLWGQYYNLPLDEFKAVVDNAVEKGYPVIWAADVSEPGFKWKKGVATIPADVDTSTLEGTELARWVQLSAKEKEAKRYEATGPVKEITVTPESRQEMFDRQETTDDHGMEIVGYATDQNGTRYYKVRNSWTDNQVYGGYLYVSEPYLLAKTLNIYVNREALPKETARKMKK